MSFPFKFIKYTQPTWIFAMYPSCKGKAPAVFKQYAQEADLSYQTTIAMAADEAYREWFSGKLIESTDQERDSAASLPPPTLYDEYRFVKKYWGTAWCFYAFIMQLFTLQNPFTNFYAWWKNRKTKQETLHNDRPVISNTLSTAKRQDKLVSVIIPTLNRYELLRDVLVDLENQTYKNIEIIIVDQSDDYKPSFYSQFKLDIHVVRQEEKLLWTARNTAIEKSKGHYLLFFDDDSRVQPDWVEMHVMAMIHYDVDISAGVSRSDSARKLHGGYYCFRWADQFDSGNAMVKRDVFEKIGLFDELFNKGRIGDAEFGMRAYRRGVRSISNPMAWRVHLKAAKGGLRESVGWDSFRPSAWFHPRPVPSVLYYLRKYFSPTLYKHAVWLSFLLSNVGFHHKGKKTMVMWSIILFFMAVPLLTVQYLRARKQASKLFEASASGRVPIVFPVSNTISRIENQ
jgi:glycosyltransferase involved in cell wall biosynthesis